MKEISVTLAGEEAVFTWREGKVYCEGYDLESERTALAMVGHGTGVGVLLVAINASCNTEAEFVSEVKKFVAGYKKIVSKVYKEWPKGQLLFEYLSYSPDPSIRWGGLEGANLSPRHYQRMWAEHGVGLKIWLANLYQLPEKYFHALLALSLSDINYALAQNESCPIDILEILAQDNDPLVRRYVAGNPQCPERTIEILAQDKKALVRMVVAYKPNCPQGLLEKLSQDKDGEVRGGAAINAACPEKTLEKLAHDKVMRVRRNVANNPTCPAGMLELLAKDKDRDVRWLVAENSGCTERVFELLIQDEDMWVRTCVARNPTCPAGILARLANDQDELVRLIVQERLARSRGLEL